MHDAAGINDDYPVGRGVFIEDTQEFVVLVNFEDHIQIIMLPGQGIKKNVHNALTRLIKLNHTFERMGFATDAYLGYLTVSPAHLGTGMHMQGSISVDISKKSEDDLMMIEERCRERISQGREMDLSFQRTSSGGQENLEISFFTK